MHTPTQTVASAPALTPGRWPIDPNHSAITRSMTLDVESNGLVVVPADGRTHFGLSAVGELRRSEFGIEFGLMPIGIDRLALADKVEFELEMQFLQPPDGSSSSPPRP